MYGDRAHYRAGNGQRQIEEHRIGAQARTTAARWHMFDRFDAERRVHQRQSKAGQASAKQSKSR